MCYQLMIRVILGCALFFASVSGAQAAGDVEKGKTLYSKRCRVCHGDKGNGNTFINNAVKVPPADFTDPVRINGLTYRRMKRSITFGRTGTAMVSWKEALSEQEIENVIQFIRTTIMKVDKKQKESHQPALDVLPDNFFSSQKWSSERLDSGKEIYHKHCYHCHGAAGDANMPVKDALLNPPRDFTDPTIVDTLCVEQMYYAIRDGIDGTAMVSWAGELTHEKTFDVIHYIRTEFMNISE